MFVQLQGSGGNNINSIVKCCCERTGTMDPCKNTTKTGGGTNFDFVERVRNGVLRFCDRDQLRFAEWSALRFCDRDQAPNSKYVRGSW